MVVKKLEMKRRRSNKRAVSRASGKAKWNSSKVNDRAHMPYSIAAKEICKKIKAESQKYRNYAIYETSLNAGGEEMARLIMRSIRISAAAAFM